MKFFTIILIMIWVLITAFSSPKASICPALRGRLNLKDNLPTFRSNCLILYDFNQFYKIINKIKDFMLKYFLMSRTLIRKERGNK